MPPVPLIPRKLLFGNPDRSALTLSPDGRRLAYVAPLDGVLNLWVAPRDDLAAAWPVTHDTGQGVRWYWWDYGGRLLYIQDQNGNGNFQLYRADAAGQGVQSLTPFEGVQARLAKLSPQLPDEAVVGLNRRRPDFHDLYRLNLNTGELTLLEENDRFFFFQCDERLEPVLAVQSTPEGGANLFKRAGTGAWELWDAVPPEDSLTTQPIELDLAGSRLLLRDSRGRNTAAIVALDLATKAATLLAEDPRVDGWEVLVHPTQKTVQAAAFVDQRKRWQVIDPAIEPDLAYLAGVADGELEIPSRSLDDQFWIARFVVDNGPARFYLYDRPRRQARFLFTDWPALEGQPLVKMHSAVIRSRDGLNLVAYVSLPPGADPAGDGRPARPLPLVLIPHGGPWGRDSWRYSDWQQWLANRGYAVLTVNFRASAGFGKAFLNAGNLEWGGKVIEDQIDAVQWAIAQGIADPQKVAALGISFGGFSTLAGLTMFPEVFACGVDICGPVNLITLLETTPDFMKSALDVLTTHVGDFRTEAGRALLKAQSPLTYVDRLRCPLLIGQGANDPIVLKAEPEQIVAAMQARGLPVTYVLYPDEGHGFARPENNQSFFAIAEAFLAQCLGGRSEPIGDSFVGSSLQVVTGAEHIPGLPEALASHSA